MKKLIASAGLVAVGAVTLNAQYAPGLSRMEASKPWSISASLRGFYDDNYNTAPSRTPDPTVISDKQDSFGFEFSPAAALNFPMENTYARLGVVYSMRYYEARESDNIDHSIEATGKLEHKFSDRFKVNVDDSFVYAQEPQIVEGTITAPLVRRREGDVLRNRANIEFDARLTDVASVAAGYQNTWYDYKDDFNAALLNRLDHRFLLDGRWKLQENLVGLVGYNYRILDYTSDDVISGVPPGPVIRGEDRSSTSHYFYVGAERALSSQLNGSVKIGANYTSYDLDDIDSTWGPYADASLTYTYLPGSYLTAGIRHDRNATDLFTPVPGTSDITTDAAYTTLYAQLSHRITPALTGSLLGQYQFGEFNGGFADGETDDLYLLGANLEYRITEHWATEAGYNFDRLDSFASLRSFTRNRVYIGVRASY